MPIGGPKAHLTKEQVYYRDRTKCLNGGRFPTSSGPLALKHRKPTRRQSSNSMQIQGQSANPTPILDQSVNTSVIHQFNVNPRPSGNPSPIRQSNANPEPIRQSIYNLPILDQSTNPSPIHQFMSTQTSLAHHQGTCEKPSKTPTNQTTVLRLANDWPKNAPILDQSENSCVSKRGTSVLCGPTEVSQQGTFSHTKKRCLCSQSHTPSLQCQLQSYSNPRECQSLTNLPIQCHSNANLIPICRFG